MNQKPLKHVRTKKSESLFVIQKVQPALLGLMEPDMDRTRILLEFIEGASHIIQMQLFQKSLYLQSQICT
jgi:hypothetical protein